MKPEVFEFIRIFAYIVGTAGLFNLYLVCPKLKVTLLAVSGYFMMRTTLLFIQFTRPEEYREMVNSFGTPFLIVVVLAIYLNVWLLRKE